MPVKIDRDSFALVPAEFVMPAKAAYPGPMAEVEQATGWLIDELRRVGWDVPGLTVEVRTTGRGKNVYRSVRSISGDTPDGPFEIGFGRSQGTRGSFNVCTLPDGVTIPPGISFQCYSDGSGSADLYIGKNWKTEGAAWMKSSRVNSKLNGNPKTYLKYSLRGGAFLHDNDLGREYDPNWREPKSLNLPKLTAEAATFIDGLTESLRNLPSAPGHDDITVEGDANMRRMFALSPQPAPADFPVLYTWVKASEAGALYGFDRENPDDDYALPGKGSRLTGGSTFDGRVMHPRAWAGFNYATTALNPKAGHRIYSAGDDSVPAEIRLKDLNEIYAVDYAAFDRRRDEVVKVVEAEGRDRMSNRELDSCQTAVAMTMVPASEYKGGFAQPVWCIGRQLDFDEARPLFGTTRIENTGSSVRAVLTDEVSGVEAVLLSYDRAGPAVIGYAERAKRTMDHYSASARAFLQQTPHLMAM